MKPILILHGALGSASQMKPLAILLSNEYKVYTLDFSGHGNNINTSTFSIDLFANDVLRFIEEKDITEPISIFGYSMGGYVALYMASLWPSKIDKIYTLATKFDWNEHSARKESEFLNPVLIEQKVPKFANMLAQRHGATHWKENCNKTAELMLSLGKHPILDNTIFKQIQHTCIISVGDIDKMVHIGETQQVANDLNNATFVLHKNMDHPFEKLDYNYLSKELITFFK
ncbi:MAG: alpha/beta fold hydrolase [Bacteroidota bacterium]